VLGVGPEADAAECRAAYRRLVREHHPDAHPDATPAQRREHAAELRRVTSAWARLLELERRPRTTTVAEPPEPAADTDDDLDLDPEPDRILSTAGMSRLPVVFAVGLVAAAFFAFALSVVMAQTALWQLSVGLGLAALISFLLLPFFVMLRSHR
jgi:hypothetical protein